MTASPRRGPDLRIELLADHPGAIPVLRAWLERQWPDYYGPGGPGDALCDLREACGRDALPIALVALADGTVCGTAALREASVSSHTHLTPWLAALLVAPEFRRRGIGEQLIAGVEDLARRHGFAELFVGTRAGSGTPEATLRRRRWEFLETSAAFDPPVLIYRKLL